MKRDAVVLAFVFFVGIALCQAQIRLPHIIGSNMVLQRNQPLPIWGWAGAGKRVTVKFAGQQKRAIADETGYWTVTLAQLAASGEGRSMLITSDTSTIKLDNILVGEVWLGSGQSNMEYKFNDVSLKRAAKGVDSGQLALSTQDPQIRLFKVEKVLSTPDVTTKYGWNDAGGDPLAEFSVPAYFFAKNLHNALHVPIGIIASSWGGSRIEPWTPPAAYKAFYIFKTDEATTPGKIDDMEPGKDFASMIKPLAPFALRGFIWYQGESNCMLNEHDMRYAYKMQALTDSWRQTWNNDRLPFYSVLIAPYLYTKRKDKLQHTVETLPEFWEQQVASLKIPYTELVSVTDLVDNPADIHPSYKWEVGRRLAAVALAKNYGFKNTVYSGPRFKRMVIKGDKGVLYFDDADGLKTTDSKTADSFTIAGTDGIYHPASAEISGNTVVVSSTEVSKPVNVRFAWTETANPNLTNSAGLPALPFRTDAQNWAYQK